jgi:cyclic dehypoxanthinyl futalosine synthase
MGPHVGQVALAFGANDMGSVMMEENVVSSAGTTYCLDEAVLCRLIRDAGFTPAQRNNTYDIIRVQSATPEHRH